MSLSRVFQTSPLTTISYPRRVYRAPVEAPENVATLVHVITSRLFNLVSDHMFPSAPTSYVPSFASSLIDGSAAERNATKEVLNCLRVLQHVLPIVFELESKPSVFEREVLWKRDVVVAEEEGVQDHRERTEQTPQFIIKDDEDENDVESATASAAAESPQIPSNQATSFHYREALQLSGGPAILPWFYLTRQAAGGPLQDKLCYMVSSPVPSSPCRQTRRPECL